MRAFSIIVVVALLSLHLACGGSSRGPEPTEVPEPPVAVEPVMPNQLASFDYIWGAIKRTHWDPEKVGASWDAIRDELRPRIAAATTRDAARAILRELLGRLEQSHFNIIGGDAEPGAEGGGAGSLGLDVRLIDDKVVVWKVTPKGAAAVAGIAPGMIVVAVNKRVWAKTLGKLRATGEPSPYTVAAMASNLVRGPVGGDAVLSLLDAADAPTSITVKWVEPPGKLASFGLLTQIPVEYESRELSKSVGYIRLSVFFDPVMVSQRFREDVKRFAAKKGLVLDLRGNPGGIGGMAMGLGGQLITKKGDKLGTMISREGKIDFVLNPQPGAFAGKLTILVDGQCASTCEILAGGLADLGRAQVIGTRTAGAALPSQIEALPNGDLIQYATANYISVSGAVLEGVGVTPTTVVPLDRKSLLSGTDPQLAAAVAWINQK